MKKFSRKSKIIYFVIVALLLSTAIFIVFINRPKTCSVITGDGYEMGFESEPVVIGNSCDK